MNRFTVTLWNRWKSLLLAPFIAALAALFVLGVNVPFAGANQPEKAKANGPKNSREYHAIRDPKVDPNMPPKLRARIQRDAAVKKMQDARKFIQDVMSGQNQASSQGGGNK